MLTDDLPLFSWRPAVEPTPTPDRYTAAANPRPRDYTAAWAKWVDEHPDAAEQLFAMAVAHLPASRCSMDGLFLALRSQLREPMNHSYRAAASDWAIAREPRLANVIERRKRRVTK